MHGIQRSAIKHSGSSKKVEIGFLKLNSFNAIFSTFLYISLFFKDFFCLFFSVIAQMFLTASSRLAKMLDLKKYPGEIFD